MHLMPPPRPPDCRLSDLSSERRRWTVLCLFAAGWRTLHSQSCVGGDVSVYAAVCHPHKLSVTPDHRSEPVSDKTQASDSDKLWTMSL